MRKVREVLRLRHALSLSYREISEALGVGKTAAGEIVRRAEVVGLTWPLPEVFDDGELERRLFTAPGEAQPERPAPNWAKLHEELKRRSVTLVLLWQEYRAEHPDGYGYSRCSAISTARGAAVCPRRCASYSGKGAPTQRYVCRGASDQMGASSCISFGGTRIDRAVAQEVLDRLQPLGIEAALAAMSAHTEEHLEKRRQLENALDTGTVRGQPRTSTV